MAPSVGAPTPRADTLDSRADNSGRRADIQGLRAVAVLLVVVYHLGLPVPGGFVGVDVFFVISGYVITRMLVAELESTGSIDFWRFYARRIRRLLPALGLMLGTVMIASVALAPIGGRDVTNRTGIAAALLNANSYLMRESQGYFDSGVELNALLHTWSLSVEEQFYLVLPALLFLAWTVGRVVPRVSTRTVVAAAFSIAIVLSFAMSFRWSFAGEFGESLAFYLSPARAWEFLAGAALVFAAAGARRLPPIIATVLGMTGAFGLGVSASAFDGATIFPGTAALLPVAATAALVLAGETATPGIITRTLSRRSATLVGDWSYSIYLWHWPWIVFARALLPGVSWAAAVGALLSLAPALASFRFLEQPIRHRPTIAFWPTVRLAAVWVAIPLSAAGLAIVATDRLEGPFTSQLALHADVVTGCDASTSELEPFSDTCTWSADGVNTVARDTVALVGDSQAGHLSEGFIAGSEVAGFDATIATLSNCPFVDLVLIRDGDTDHECRQFVIDVTAALVRRQPELIVIASATDKYIQSPGTEVVDTAGVRSSSEAEKSDAWSHGLTRTIERLERAGSMVVVVYPTPKYENWDAGACAAVLSVVNPRSCSVAEPTTQLAARRSVGLRVEQRAVSGTDAQGIDFFDELCSEETCRADRGGRWLWRDAGHISIEQSTRLTPLFAELFTELSEDRRGRKVSAASAPEYLSESAGTTAVRMRIGELSSFSTESPN